MNRTSQFISMPIDPSTIIDFDCAHPLGNILKVATNQSLSVEARLLYVILCLMAWSKGRCWPGQAHQSQALGRSERQIRRYHGELEKAGILGINRRPGQSSQYYPRALRSSPATLDLRAPDTHVQQTLKQELKNVQNVVPVPIQTPETHETPSALNHENVNASRLFPKPKDATASKTPVTVQRAYAPRSSSHPMPTKPKQSYTPKAPPNSDHLFIVEEIERVTGDSWSRRHFLNLIRTVNEQTIWSALSVTREKLALETGVNGGAYFTATVRAMAGLKSLTSNRSPSVPSTAVHTKKRPMSKPRAVSTPTPDPVDEIDVTALVKGWKVLYQPGRVESVLFHIGRCFDDWDVTGAWHSLAQDRAGVPELEVMDEFLDLAAFKVRFQATGQVDGPT